MPSQHRIARLRTLATVGATTILVALAGCAAGGATPTRSTSSTVDLRVGVLQANNANFTLPSKSTTAAGEVAAKTLKVPGVKIEQFPIANDGTPNGAIQAVQRAVQDDKITVVTGFITSDVAAALSAQASRLGVLIVDAISQDPSLQGANCTADYFRVTHNSLQADLADFSLPATKGLKTWDVFAPDNNYGHGAVTAFVAAAKTRGITVKQQLFETPGTTDFSPFISKLSADPADGLLVVSAGTDAGTFAVQAQSFKLFKKYQAVVGQGLIVAETLPSTGTALDGVQEVFAWTPDSTSSGSAEFVKAFHADSSATLNYIAANAYTAFQVAAQAAAAAKSTEPNAMAKQISGKSFETIAGKITFRAADHMTLRPLTVIQIKIVGGKATIVPVSQLPASATTPPVNPACKL